MKTVSDFNLHFDGNILLGILTACFPFVNCMRLLSFWAVELIFPRGSVMRFPLFLARGSHSECVGRSDSAGPRVVAEGWDHSKNI